MGSVRLAASVRLARDERERGIAASGKWGECVVSVGGYRTCQEPGRQSVAAWFFLSPVSRLRFPSTPAMYRILHWTSHLPGVTMSTRSPCPRAVGGLLALALLAGAVSQSNAQPQAPLRPGQSPGPRFVMPALKGEGDGTRLGLQVAKSFRAEELLEGVVTRTAAGGYRVEAAWSLGARDDMVQPLPPVEATK